MLEDQEPNKLKEEIYRLKYKHGRFEEAKAKLKQQKQEIDNVKVPKTELQEHMKEYKVDQEFKRQSMHKKIQEKKKQISEKEALIREKLAELKKTEDDYEVKLRNWI